MKSSRNELLARVDTPPVGSTGVESLYQGLLWNDPAAYEGAQALQTFSPEYSQYLYNPETHAFHPVYPVEGNPFEGASGGESEGGDDGS